MGTWDTQRKCYYDRGLGFWGNVAVLIFIGVSSVIFLSVLIWHDGWYWLASLIIWVPVYLSGWDSFSTDYQWPKKSIEQIKREDEAYREKILKEIEIITGRCYNGGKVKFARGEKRPLCDGYR